MNNQVVKPLIQIRSKLIAKRITNNERKDNENDHTVIVIYFIFILSYKIVK